MLRVGLSVGRGASSPSPYSPLGPRVDKGQRSVLALVLYGHRDEVDVGAAGLAMGQKWIGLPFAENIIR